MEPTSTEFKENDYDEEIEIVQDELESNAVRLLPKFKSSRLEALYCWDAMPLRRDECIVGLILEMFTTVLSMVVALAGYLIGTDDITNRNNHVEIIAYHLLIMMTILLHMFLAYGNPRSRLATVRRAYETPESQQIALAVMATIRALVISVFSFRATSPSMYFSSFLFLLLSAVTAAGMGGLTMNSATIVFGIHFMAFIITVSVKDHSFGLSENPVHRFTWGVVSMLGIFVAYLELQRCKELDLRESFLTGRRNILQTMSMERLLYSNLPEHVVMRLRVSPLTQVFEPYPSVTVCFIEIAGCDQLAHFRGHRMMIQTLDRCWSAIDNMTSSLQVWKVEHVLNEYMFVAGCPQENPNHVASAANAAQVFLKEIRGMLQVSALELTSSDTFRFTSSNMMSAAQTTNFRSPANLDIRIGLHTGPVTGAAVGLVAKRYCLFGDTVNMAARMKSYGEANRIHVSEDVARQLQHDSAFHLVERGNINIKGKGICKTFWLESGSEVKHHTLTPVSSKGDLEEPLFRKVTLKETENTSFPIRSALSKGANNPIQSTSNQDAISPIRNANSKGAKRSLALPMESGKTPTGKLTAGKSLQDVRSPKQKRYNRHKSFNVIGLRKLTTGKVQPASPSPPSAAAHRLGTSLSSTSLRESVSNILAGGTSPLRRSGTALEPARSSPPISDSGVPGSTSRSSNNVLNTRPSRTRPMPSRVDQSHGHSSPADDLATAYNTMVLLGSRFGSRSSESQRVSFTFQYGKGPELPFLAPHLPSGSEDDDPASADDASAGDPDGAEAPAPEIKRSDTRPAEEAAEVDRFDSNRSVRQKFESNLESKSSHCSLPSSLGVTTGLRSSAKTRRSSLPDSQLARFAPPLEVDDVTGFREVARVMIGLIALFFTLWLIQPGFTDMFSLEAAAYCDVGTLRLVAIDNDMMNGDEGIKMDWEKFGQEAWTVNTSLPGNQDCLNMLANFNYHRTGLLAVFATLVVQHLVLLGFSLVFQDHFRDLEPYILVGSLGLSLVVVNLFTVATWFTLGDPQVSIFVGSGLFVTVSAVLTGCFQCPTVPFLKVAFPNVVILTILAISEAVCCIKDRGYQVDHFAHLVVFLCFMIALSVVLWLRQRTSLLLVSFTHDLLMFENATKKLINTLFSESVATRLIRSRKQFVERCPESTILMCDIVGSTKLAASLDPGEVAELLHVLYTEFDTIAMRHGVQKITTIGDAYVAAAGPCISKHSSEEGAFAIVAMAQDMIEASRQVNFNFSRKSTWDKFRKTRNIVTMQHVLAGVSVSHQGVTATPDNDESRKLAIRIGVDTGMVYGGVVGQKQLAYQIWGEALQVATKMESSSRPEAIHVSKQCIEFHGGRSTLEQYEKTGGEYLDDGSAILFV